MSTTHTFNKLVLVHRGPASTTFFLLEESYSSNVHPQTKRWDVLYCGSYAKCFSKILEWSYFADGNGIRDVAKTSAGYIGRWRDAFANPRELRTATLRARIGGGLFDLNPTEIQSIEKELVAAGGQLASNELVLSLDSSAQAELLEQHQRGLLPLSAFMRPALSFVGDVTTVPDQVCANRRRMKDLPFAAEVHGIPTEENWRQFFIVADGHGVELVCSTHAWMTRVLIACEITYPGSAEDACRLVTHMVKTAAATPRLPIEWQTSSAVVTRDNLLATWQQDRYDKLADAIGRQRDTDRLEIPLPLVGKESVARNLSQLAPAQLITPVRSMTQAPLF